MTFQMLLRSVWRVLWFAVAGAFCMAIVGAVAGSATGALYKYLDEITFGYNPHRNVMSVCRSGAEIGSTVAAFVGAIAGAVAFGVAGIISCLSTASSKILKTSLHCAARASLSVMTICLMLSSFNYYVWSLYTGEKLSFPSNNYILVVITGFVLGTFYGAIVGAKRELARQRTETKNASLSVAESEASSHRVLDVAS